MGMITEDRKVHFLSVGSQLTTRVLEGYDQRTDECCNPLGPSVYLK